VLHFLTCMLINLTSVSGNIGTATNDHIDPTDLSTPTLKSDVYTTGRGGSGNMAHNSDPRVARRAQDVEASLPRPESASHDVHVGRGGAANVFKPTPEEIEKAKRENEQYESVIAEGRGVSHERGLADKGKEWLFGNKSKTNA